ncbi:MAG TPA: putative toxin-antitoxin system toxin component, PIN family [Polyangia bacterium]|nr:putative toxin-antitoxin system toxin component, PIN family [Polyangia bacterium]
MPGAVPKAVLDTQLVVRGLVRRRKSAAVELFDLALEGVRMLAVTSPVLLEEYESVLRLPHVRGLTNPPLDDDLIQRAIQYIGERFIVVAGAFKDVDKVPDDAKDNPLVEAALEGAAEAIISDDVDLLSLKVVKVRGFRPVQIYAPGPFLKYVLE